MPTMTVGEASHGDQTRSVMLGERTTVVTAAATSWSRLTPARSEQKPEQSHF